MKKLLPILLSILLTAILVPVLLHTATADTVTGQCGDNLYWEFDEDSGTLTITGSGAMYNCSNASDWGWHSVRSTIQSVVLPNEITTIGNYAFYSCTELKMIDIRGV